MKKILSMLLLSLVLVLSACGSDEPEKETPEVEDTPKQDEVEKDEPAEEEPVEEEPEEDGESNEETNDEPAIDTSMYEYAENVEVTDALEINDHITLIIDMPESNTRGLAFQHVLNQSYDFLEQDSTKKAKTIGVNIRQGGNKIAMFTIYTEKFVENDDKPMAQLVLDASVVEMTLPEVDQYAETMDLKMNKE